MVTRSSLVTASWPRPDTQEMPLNQSLIRKKNYSLDNAFITSDKCAAPILALGPERGAIYNFFLAQMLNTLSPIMTTGGAQCLWTYEENHKILMIELCGRQDVHKH